MSSHNHRVPAPRKWTVLLLGLLFVVTASAQAVHTHRSSLPSAKRVSDTLDSNAAARCGVCLHSQAGPLGRVAILISPHVAAEAAALPSLLEPPGPGEEWVHRVRPPPAA